MWKMAEEIGKNRRGQSDADPRYFFIRIPLVLLMSVRSQGRFAMGIHKGMAVCLVINMLLWAGIIEAARGFFG